MREGNSILKSMVIDVSVFVDYFVVVEGREDRHRIAVEFLNKLSDRGAIVYEPFVFEVELCAVLVRYIEPKYVTEILEVILNHIAMIKEDELHSEAKAIALKTGCRAIDAYYIATAKLVDAILVTNDGVMKSNADRAGVEAYYLAKDYEKLHRVI